jgi:hypothetical protein
MGTWCSRQWARWEGGWWWQGARRWGTVPAMNSSAATDAPCPSVSMSLLHARRLDRAFAFGRIHTDVMVTMMMMVIMMMMMMMMMVMMMVTMTMTTVAVAVCGCGPSPQVGRGGGVALGTAAYDPRKKAWER